MSHLFSHDALCIFGLADIIPQSLIFIKQVTWCYTLAVIFLLCLSSGLFLTLAGALETFSLHHSSFHMALYVFLDSLMSFLKVLYLLSKVHGAILLRLDFRHVSFIKLILYLVKVLKTFSLHHNLFSSRTLCVLDSLMSY